MMLALNISILWRLNRVEKKIDAYDKILTFHLELLTDIKKKMRDK
tara:strand:+ start:1793 stop:1927 length:135 start_codon:yes stop_codon:yes gene_type:complete